jgi:hypothetical protein
MATVGGKEKDVWGRPCSCQGLNTSCFKCGGFGMLREPPVVPMFYEFTQVDRLKLSKSGKSYVVEDYKKEPPGVVKRKKANTRAKIQEKVGDLTLNKEIKKPAGPVSSYSYYCSQCKEYLKPFQLFDHSQHVDKILQNLKPIPAPKMQKGKS